MLPESGYYPAGAEFDSSAPWNQKETPLVGTNVFVSQTLVADKLNIVTDKYVEYADEEGSYKEFNEEEVKKDALEQVITPIKILEAIPDIYEELLNTIDAKYLSKLKILAETCKIWKLEDEYVEI